jgi:hypothetical protein
VYVVFFSLLFCVCLCVCESVSANFRVSNVLVGVDCFRGRGKLQAMIIRGLAHGRVVRQC